MHQFLRRAAKKDEGVQQGAPKGHLILTVGKLDIQQPGVALDHGHTIKLAPGGAVGQGPKMSPVALALLTGRALKADAGRRYFALAPDSTQMGAQDGQAAAVTPLLQPLADDHGAGLGPLDPQAVDLVQVGRQLAGTGCGGGSRRLRFGQIFADALPADAQPLGDLPRRQSLIRQAVNLENCPLINHVSRSRSTRDSRMIWRMVKGSSRSKSAAQVKGLPDSGMGFSGRDNT